MKLHRNDRIKLLLLFTWTLFHSTFSEPIFLDALRSAVENVRFGARSILGDLGIKEDPLVFASSADIIRYHGYKAEVHNVTSEDGYITTLVRIPAAKSGKAATREPVLLHHGVISSSADWLLVSPDKGLPFMLADAGYDVFIANARGSEPSQMHVKLTKKDDDYWKFSFHEIGKYDIKAQMLFMLKLTKQKKLSYVGYSMGCAVFFIALSQNPELRPKIRKMVALAPAVYINHCSTSLGKLAGGVLPEMLKIFTPLVFALHQDGPLEVPETLGEIKKAIQSVLARQLPFAGAMPNLLLFITGYDPSQANTTTLQRVVGHSPAATSIRTFNHFLQFFTTGIFAPWNSKKEYGFDNIKGIPIVVINGEKDFLVMSKDVDRTVASLKKVKGSVVQHCRDAKGLNHLDFMYGDTVRTSANDKIMEFFLDKDDKKINIKC